MWTGDECAALIQSSSFLWHQRFELAPGIFTPGVSDVAFLADAAEMPHDLSGMRVLDVGTTNGCAAIEMERRGADQMVAVDIVPPSLFGFLDSRVEFVRASLYEPLTDGVLSVECAVADHELGGVAGLPVARFYRLDELGGDSSNWFAPSVAGLTDWLRSCGFEPTKIEAWRDVLPSRAMVNATVLFAPPEYQRVSYEVPLRAKLAAHEP